MILFSPVSYGPLWGSILGLGILSKIGIFNSGFRIKEPKYAFSKNRHPIICYKKAYYEECKKKKEKNNHLRLSYQMNNALA